MIILMFTQTRDIDLETTWYYYDTFPLSPYGTDISESRKKTPVFQISAYRFFLEICCRRILWRVCRSMTERRIRKQRKGKWSRRGSIPSATLSDRKLCPSVLFRLPSEISFLKFRKKLTQNTRQKKKPRRIIRNSTEIYPEKGLQISRIMFNRELNDVMYHKGTLRVIERAVEAQPCEMQKMSDGRNNGR